jgi:hypothetical protein
LRADRKRCQGEQNGEESQEAEIFEGSGQEGEARHEEAQIRHAQSGSEGQGRSKPSYRFRGAQGRAKVPEETLKEALKEKSSKLFRGTGGRRAASSIDQVSVIGAPLVRATASSEPAVAFTNRRQVVITVSSCCVCQFRYFKNNSGAMKF